MNFLALAYVAFGGAVGSMCRYLMSVGIGKLNQSNFPLATFIINISGSFLMGVWIGYMALALPSRGRELHMLVAVGVLGGYTTFSTFSLDAYLLIEKGLWLQAAIYMLGSIVLSVSALFAGMWLMRLISL